ncbi:SLC13 family permease [Streptomyces sp. NPDC001893]|uniref:SLC13 family permease n=1 Tax=Streptomyces sp. NPDC001893 TaxID=3154530 RepID=UPI003329DA8C
MSVPEVLSVVLLVSAFGLAMWRDVNVGLVVLPAAFAMSAIAGIPKEEVLAGFPADLVVLILGVMYMFGHAQRSGAIDRVVRLVVRLSRGRDWFLPWGMFLVAAALSAIGTLPSATVAVVLPMAMRIARTRDVDPVLMAVVACGGAGVGGVLAAVALGRARQGARQEARRHLLAHGTVCRSRDPQPAPGAGRLLRPGRPAARARVPGTPGCLAGQ